MATYESCHIEGTCGTAVFPNHHRCIEPGLASPDLHRRALNGPGSPTEDMMAQKLVSLFICDGRFRIHAINAVDRRRGRIIEVEEVDTGERFHGSARRMERLVRTLRASDGDMSAPPAWTPHTRS